MSERVAQGVTPAHKGLGLRGAVVADPNLETTRQGEGDCKGVS